MSGFHEDHRSAQRAWQQMAAAMDKKRNAGPEKPAAASGPRRRSERENALVKLLKETPGGMTLAELSYAMEMPSAATSKILKQMLKRKRAAIRKKDQLYLAS
jgi:predicted transcriptional regulator